MNYLRIYNNIIYTAQQRILPPETYKENHHIRPRGIGGTDINTNVVSITAKEHFICHHLLTKLYPDNIKILMGFWIMVNGFTTIYQDRTYRVTARVFSTIREKAMTTLHEHTKGLPSPMKGKHHTPEAKLKLRLAKLGVPNSKEANEKIRQVRIGTKRSLETCKKISVATKGKKKNNTRKRICHKRIDDVSYDIKADIVNMHKQGEQLLTIGKKYHINYRDTIAIFKELNYSY